MKKYSISVRALVEFLLRQGDLGGGYSSAARAQEGTRLHQKLQKAAGPDYQKEVPFLEEYPFGDESVLCVEGRADGLYPDDEGGWTIDEIKSTTVLPEKLEENQFPLHWAQAQCYGAMFCRRENEERVRIRLSYIHTETEEVRYFYRTYEAEALERFWKKLLEEYRRFIEWQENWQKKRNASLQTMEFPYAEYRPGQRTMAAYVYQTIRDRKHLFLQAPTGIGKTLSALFPALKALGGEMGEKIFYLTAKNLTAQAPEAALTLLRTRGLCCQSVVITAKDKICPQTERHCTAEACPYAKGHFDRINEALFQALKAEIPWNKDTLRAWAQQFRVCPFELSLELAEWADVIICDYNYAFDPTASLKRFFQDRHTEYLLLVDEAHNLVDRSREMFSASLDRESVMAARRILKKDKEPALYRSLDGLRKLFLTLKKEIGEQNEIRQKAPEDAWRKALWLFSERMEAYLQEQKGEAPEELLNLYFQVLFFQRIWEEAVGSGEKGPDRGYEYYVQRLGSNLRMKFFCVNPATALKETYASMRAVIFFSATLTPIQYYKTLLGGEEDPAIALPSPFDPTRQQVMIGALDASYQGRQKSLTEACRWIASAVTAKEGHYLVFFPSFAYLQMVAETMQADYPQLPIRCQEAEMSEEAKKAFLEAFEAPDPIIGFAVLGGAFSEGIDLKGDRLIGTIILSVGLPQVGFERDLIREHMEREVGAGFEYAYLYPGLGRVFQAAGRVIRTEPDAGTVLLLDRRFAEERYRALYPSWWRIRQVQPETIEDHLHTFWNQIV